MHITAQLTNKVHKVHKQYTKDVRDYTIRRYIQSINFQRRITVQWTVFNTSLMFRFYYNGFLKNFYFSLEQKKNDFVNSPHK